MLGVGVWRVRENDPFRLGLLLLLWEGGIRGGWCRGCDCWSFISEVRMRQVLSDVGGATVLEGTFATQERVDSQKNDLVWLRLTLAAGPVNLYGRMEASTALASGEYRFRTVAQRFSAEINNQLKTAAGVPIGNTPFEGLSLLSTPVDLYALGVLGVRSLLANPRTPLPVVLDEVLSLARQVATEHDPAVSLGLRISTLFDRDKRWLESLGPQHLVHDQVSPEKAFTLGPLAGRCD